MRVITKPSLKILLLQQPSESNLYSSPTMNALAIISFATLKLTARCNLIPKELVVVDQPVCPRCTYGKDHYSPWSHKGISNLKRIKPATIPGQCVSVDQLVSPTPGFVHTHRGRPTLKRYVGVTVFVDH